MHNLEQEMSVPESLVREWNFQIGDQESAFGEMAEMPAVLTILGVDPLSLMMTYKIATPHPAQIPMPAEIAQLLETKSASVALEDGYAWLSFYNLRGKSAEAVRGLFESFGQALKDQGLALEPACSICGQREDAGLIYVEGKCTRICEPCLEQRLEEREAAEAALNRPSSLHSYALPWVIALAGLGWAVFWVLIDLLLDFFNVQVIEINAFTSVIFIVVAGVLGVLVGTPLGHVLRKSGSVRLSPLAVTIIAIGLATVIGEALYISIAIFRWIGHFDLTLGFQALFPWIQSYNPFWIICKLIVAGAIGFGCFQAASERESVGLSI